MPLLTSPVITGEMNELAGQLGIATLLFFSVIIIAGVLFVYIRSQAQNQQKALEIQARENDERQQKERAIYDKIIDTIRQDREKDQQILTNALEDNRQQISVLRSVVEKMKSHDQAVQVLLDKTSRILENRCINQLKKSQP